MNFADQLLFLDFVVNLRFLSARKGPTMETSTKGRNIPDVCHFMSLAAMTDGEKWGTRGTEGSYMHGLFLWISHCVCMSLMFML